MLNDRSTPLSLLETRRSAKPREMVGPAPSADELERMLAIAARVPDHGKLAPWRFVTVADDQRDALAALLHDALDAEDPAATPAHHDKAEQFAALCGRAGGAGLGAGRRSQDPAVGAGTVVRRGGDEPAASAPTRSAMSAAG